VTTAPPLSTVGYSCSVKEVDEIAVAFGEGGA